MATARSREKRGEGRKDEGEMIEGKEIRGRLRLQKWLNRGSILRCVSSLSKLPSSSSSSSSSFSSFFLESEEANGEESRGRSFFSFYESDRNIDDE